MAIVKTVKKKTNAGEARQKQLAAIEDTLEKLEYQKAVRDELKKEMEKTEKIVKEMSQELEGMMRAAKVGLPGKENPALEIGEVKLKIVEGENRWVDERAVIAKVAPLMAEEDNPIKAAKKLVGECTKVTEYSYVRVTRKKEKEEKEEEEGEESDE